MNAHLVQRGNFNKRDAKGIDSILRFDYMGSSEYEWGALPDSLKVIRSKISNYSFIQLEIGKLQVEVFCGSEHLKLVEEYLIKLSKNEFCLQEYSGFNDAVKSKKSPDFWWDIENHLMFWKKDDQFKEDFEKLIQAFPETNQKKKKKKKNISIFNLISKNFAKK